MLPLLYDLAYYTALIPLAPLMLYKSIRRGKYRQSVPGMLGRGLKEAQAAVGEEGCIWLHAVSVGEVVAARSMVPQIRRLWPDLPLVVSTTTETGQAHARRLFGDDAAAVIFYPIDFSWNVRRFFRALRPEAVLLLEGELWPNLLTHCRREDVFVALMNGDLSHGSFKGYKRLLPVLRRPFEALQLCCMQTDEDARKMRQLLGTGPKITVTGNIKFDQLPAPLSPEARADLCKEIGFTPDRPAIVFGSTHPGEEESALDLLKQMRAAGRNEALILCPRHPERFDEVARLVGEACEANGWRYTRASEANQKGASPHGSADILLLDQMGVLAQAFGLGQLAVLGGSFAEIGGHNLLEPAAHGIPVLHGPHMFDQPAIVELMKAGGVDFEVSESELADRVIELLGNPGKLLGLGEKSALVADHNRGAAKRSGDAIGALLGLPRKPIEDEDRANAENSDPNKSSFAPAAA